MTVLSKKTLPVTTRDQLIIVFAVLGVYAQVVYLSGLNLDDFNFISRLEIHSYESQWINWFKSQKAVVYFRPLLELISVMDFKIWGFQYTGYHFTNLLTHLMNSLLVYSIALKLFEKKLSKSALALFSALFFGIHPLTCESVTWISGRSDLFGTLFVLISFRLFLMKGILKFFAVPFFLLLGLFCKENALSLVPILLLSHILMGYYERIHAKDIAVSTVIWAIVVSIPLGIYIYLRTGGGAGLSNTYTNVDSDAVTNSFSTLFLLAVRLMAASGFYLKKLFVPLPLNIAISSINIKAYALLFVGFIGVNIFWLIKKSYDFILLSLLIFFSFIPALIVGLGGVSWMPYAERYLYLSVAVLGIIASIWLSSNNYIIKFRSEIFILFLVILALVTLNRLQDWKTSENLFADTLKKNPNNGKVLYKYGITIGKEKGRQYFEKAIDVANDSDWKDLSSLELASYHAEKKDQTNMMLYIDKALDIKTDSKNLIRAAEILTQFQPETKREQIRISNKRIELYKKAYEKKKNAFILYQIIKISRELSRKDLENKYCSILMNDYPNSEYARYAGLKR